MRNRKLIGHYDPVRFRALLKKQDLWCIGKNDGVFICTNIFIYKLTNWEYAQLILTLPWASEIKDSWNKNWEKIGDVVQEMKTPPPTLLQAIKDAESFHATEPKALKRCSLMARIPSHMSASSKKAQIYVPLFHNSEDEAHRFVTWVNEAFLDAIPGAVLKARTSVSTIAAVIDNQVIGIIIPGFLSSDLNDAVKAYFDVKDHKSKLYVEYMGSEDRTGYVRWLEDQVTSLRNRSKMEALMRRPKTCLSLRALFENLQENNRAFTIHGYRIVHDQNEDSFDLIDNQSRKLCCDGEECEILNAGVNDATFRTLGTSYIFTLSRDEIEVAVFA